MATHKKPDDFGEFADLAKADKKEDAKAAHDGLVVMVKDGEEHLLVHPTCVDAHVKAGWKPKG